MSKEDTGKQDLAEESFELADWTIRPESCEILSPSGVTEILRPRIMDVLVFLASKPGKVISAEELLDNLWSDVTVNEESVYWYVSQLRSALGDDTKNPSFIETIPKRGYRLIAPVRFLKEQNGDSDALELVSKTTESGRKKILALTGVLALAVLVVSYQYLNVIRTPTLPVPARSIAVMPFVDLSPEGNQEYFADGIAEDLLNTLARVPQLRVTGRTSSFTFRGEKENLQVIGEALGVAHILEGSVRRDGDRVRVTAQLAKASDGFHIWSETYDRELGDIFAIQDEIAKAIVSALKSTLGVDVGPVSVEAPTVNIEAYDLYLRAREYFLTRNILLMNEAVGLFEQAIALDPTFAEAHQGLAALYLVLPDYDSRYDYLESMENADQMARRALSLDATLALAHAIVGQGFGKRHRWDEANAAFDLALRHGPGNSTVRLWRGLHLIRLGYLEKAHNDIAAGLKADPASGIHNSYMAWSLFVLGRAEEALPYGKKSLSLGYAYAYLSLSATYLALGKVDEAKRMRQSQSNNEEDMVLGPTVLDMLLNPDERPVIRQRLQALAAEKGIDLQAYMKNDPGNQFAYGDFEAAAETMLRLDMALHWTWSPFFHDYRRSAVFKDMLRRANLIDYWNANGWPKQCRVLTGDDFECD